MDRPRTADGGVHHVSPDGDDGAAGTKFQPWQTIQASISKLESGDTLLVHGGEYDGAPIEITDENTPDGPVAIRAADGETPVVDGYIDAFKDPEASPWQPIDRDRNLWRSTDTYEGPLNGKIETEDGPVALVPYQLRNRFFQLPYDKRENRHDHLTSDTEVVTEDGVRYLGPGIAYKGPIDEPKRHIDLRLQPPNAEAVHRSFDVPKNRNPNEQPIYISTEIYGIVLENAADVTIDGLRIDGFDRSISVNNCDRVQLTNLDLQYGASSVYLRNDVSDLTIERCSFNLHFPPWVAWTDVKGSGGIPARMMESSAIYFYRDATGASDVEVKDCHFNGVFDGLNTGTSGSIDGIRVVHNRFDVIDDSFEIPDSGNQIEFGNNLVLGPGPSHDDRRGSGSGARWIHHNVIDVRRKQLWGRSDPQKLLKRKHRGWFRHAPVPTHGDAPATGDSWKIYNNTVLFGKNVTGNGNTLSKWSKGNRDVPHEVYNNISYQVSDRRHVQRAVVGDVYDGNLYHDAFGGKPERDYFIDVKGPGSNREQWDSLEAFKQSNVRNATTAYYPPGWEAASIQTGPEREPFKSLRFPDSKRDHAPEMYRPADDGPAASGALDLSDTGWPGANDAGYRGALPPEGDTVGIRE